MSSIQTTATDTASTINTDWSELASRENDGLEVSLLWSKATGRTTVVVSDSKLDEAFELEVPGVEALEAFNHPFAYAAAEGLFFDAPRESTDLQLQS